MNIGIDAKWFFNGPPSGVVVVRNIVEQLIRYNRTHHLHLFLDRREKLKKFPFSSERVHLHYVWADNNLLSNLFLLPVYARKLHLDNVVFLNFSPVGGGFKKVSFVLDVIFASNPEFFSLLERLYFSPLRFLTRRADRVFTISDSEKRRMIRFGYADESLIDIIPLGVDENFRPKEFFTVEKLASVRARYNLPGRFILYVGRLNVRKNIANLLRALVLLRHSDIPLVIAGEQDWKMPSVQSIINDLNLGNRLVFTGRIEDTHLPAVFSLATIFVYPSFEEGFGLPPLEAMASGVPVVVSARSSLPEVCADSGTYCDPYEPVSIAGAIDRLLQDDNYFSGMRARGLQRAAEYTWERSAKILLDSIERLYEC